MSLERTDIDIIKRIILEETLFLRHYIGQVINIVDPEFKGKIQVKIPDLMTDFSSGDNSGFWCVPRDKNAITNPKLKDWVEVYFVNGNLNFPVYMGIANEMRDMLPTNFDGNATTHILFESPENKIHLKYDEIVNILEIGNNNFLEAARKTDATLSNSSLDSTFWSFIDNLVSIFNAHTHAGVTTGGGVSGTTATPLSGKPTQLVGKINAGSNQIKIGDR